MFQGVALKPRARIFNSTVMSKDWLPATVLRTDGDGRIIIDLKQLAKFVGQVLLCAIPALLQKSLPSAHVAHM